MSSSDLVVNLIAEFVYDCLDVIYRVVRNFYASGVKLKIVIKSLV
jgi:hypothetical protein